MTEYFVPSGDGSAEYTEKRSRFIGQTLPVQTEEEAQAFIARIRKENRDARHNCYAYITGPEGSIEKCSDDGEPSRTAGMPMMDALRGAGVTDVLCVVTRYFGGILLGTGGLVRAYSRTCAEAISAAGILRMAPCDLVAFSVPYAQWAMFQQEARKHGASLSPEYGEVVRCTIAVETGKTKAFLDAVFDQSAGTLTGERSGSEYRPIEDNESR